MLLPKDALPIRNSRSLPSTLLFLTKQRTRHSHADIRIGGGPKTDNIALSKGVRGATISPREMEKARITLTQGRERDLLPDDSPYDIILISFLRFRLGTLEMFGGSVCKRR